MTPQTLTPEQVAELERRLAAYVTSRSDAREKTDDIDEISVLVRRERETLEEYLFIHAPALLSAARHWLDDAAPCIHEEQLTAATARAEAAERDYAACAHAIGIEHVPDTGPTAPGPVKAVVWHIEEAFRQALDRQEAIDRADAADARAQAAEKRCASAEAKAIQFERDWYDAKSEFGTASAKQRERIRELEAIVQELADLSYEPVTSKRQVALCALGPSVLRARAALAAAKLGGG